MIDYEHLKIRRKVDGISQSDMARRLRVSHSSIHRWERGIDTPNTERIPAICRAYGTTPNRLFSWTTKNF